MFVLSLPLLVQILNLTNHELVQLIVFLKHEVSKLLPILSSMVLHATCHQCFELHHVILLILKELPLSHIESPLVTPQSLFLVLLLLK